MDVEVEPWADHAALMKPHLSEAANRRDEEARDGDYETSKGKGGGGGGEGASQQQLSAPVTQVLFVSVSSSGRKGRHAFGIVADDEGVITELKEQGAVADEAADGRDADGREETLRVGDKIVEINGKIMHGLCMNPIYQPVANSKGSQIVTALANILQRKEVKVEFLIHRRQEAAALPPPGALPPPPGSEGAAAADGNLLYGNLIAQVDASTQTSEPGEGDKSGVEEKEAAVPAIILSNIHFGYDAERDVLEGISMIIPEGAKVGLLGRSGCGKSTLLKLMSRVYQPRPGGTVRYFDAPVNELILEDASAFLQQVSALC